MVKKLDAKNFDLPEFKKVLDMPNNNGPIGRFL